MASSSENWIDKVLEPYPIEDETYHENTNEVINMLNILPSGVFSNKKLGIKPKERNLISKSLRQTKKACEKREKRKRARKQTIEVVERPFNGTEEEADKIIKMSRVDDVIASVDERIASLGRINVEPDDNQEKDNTKVEEQKKKKKGVVSLFKNTYPKYYTDVIDSYDLEEIYGDAINSDIYPVTYSWTDPKFLKRISYTYDELPDYLKLLITEDELYDYVPGQQIGHTIFSIPVLIEDLDDNEDGWKKQISFFESIVLNNIDILLDAGLDINIPPSNSKILELLCCKFYYHSIISSRTDRRRVVCQKNDKKELEQLADYIRKYGIVGKEGDKKLNNILLTTINTTEDKSKLFTDPEVPYLKESVTHVIDLDKKKRDEILKRKADYIQVYRNINHGYPHVVAYFNKTSERFDIAMSRRTDGNPWLSVRGFIRDGSAKYAGPKLKHSRTTYGGEVKALKRVVKLISGHVARRKILR
ncbi:Hypothetical protein SRAE_X000206200 [Strongyloides ratti]|uniref:Uncharacterized protein n=1 Tax=Strongyloides ratti TaxID=34506 RepID=A0A090KYN5_STRRB|nr:Hypothetical protein SRAE_X000206200 [Strongyloides ratti]CEF60324.1 Hypothetical protein SRAE_X000206200 [Strongyloides ratti]